MTLEDASVMLLLVDTFFWQVFARIPTKVPVDRHASYGVLMCQGTQITGLTNYPPLDRLYFKHLVVMGVQCMVPTLPLNHVGNLTVAGNFTHNLEFPRLKQISSLAIRDLRGKGFLFPAVETLGDVALTKVTAEAVRINSKQLGHVTIDECHISILDFGHLQTAHTVKLQRSTLEIIQMHMLESLGGDLIIVMNKLCVGKALPMLRIIKGSIILHIIEARAIDFGVESVGGDLLISALRAKVIKLDSLNYVEKQITLRLSERLLLFSLSNLVWVDEIRMLANAKVLHLNPHALWNKKSLFDADNFCALYRGLFWEMEFQVAGGCQHPICHSNLALTEKDLPAFKTCTNFYGDLIIDRRVTGNLTRSLLTSVRGSITLHDQERFPFPRLSKISETLLITGQSKDEIWDLSSLSVASEIVFRDLYGVKEFLTSSSLESSVVIIKNTSLQKAIFHQQKLEHLIISDNPALSAFGMPILLQLSSITVSNNPSLKLFPTTFPRLDTVVSGISFSRFPGKYLDLSSLHNQSLIIDGSTSLNELRIKRDTISSLFSSPLIVAKANNDFVTMRAPSNKTADINPQPSRTCENYYASQEIFPPNLCQVIQKDLVIKNIQEPLTLFFPELVHGNVIIGDLNAEVTLPRLEKVYGKIICHSASLHLVKLPSLESVGGLVLSNIPFLPPIYSQISVSRELTLISSSLLTLPKMNLHRYSKLVLKENRYLQSADIRFKSGIAEKILIVNNPRLAALHLESLTAISRNLVVVRSSLSAISAGIINVDGDIVIKDNPHLAEISFPNLASMGGLLKIIDNPLINGTGFQADDGDDGGTEDGDDDWEGEGSHFGGREYSLEARSTGSAVAGCAAVDDSEDGGGDDHEIDY